MAATIGSFLVCSMPACSKPQPLVMASVRSEDVRFRNGEVTLAGTLFLPAGTGKHPAIVIFHGSGAETRNNFMANWFAEQGVACLTYDKRGTGESGGDFQKIPFPELTDDGLAAVALLKSRPEVDAAQIGVWGLSQGGWLGPLAASQSKNIAFVIAVSGPGVNPGEQMIFYYGRQLHYRGVADAEISEASDLRRKVWRFLSTGTGHDDAAAALARSQSRPWFAELQSQQDGLFKASAASILNDKSKRETNWFKYEISYDPTVALRKLTVPALFIFGEADDLVPVHESVAIIRHTLTEAGHHDFTIKVFPDANHGIQLTDGRFAPGYLDTMRDWLRAHTH